MKLFLCRFLLLAICLLNCVAIDAYDFMLNGIYYNILSDNQVEVTYKAINANGYYNSTIVIPSSVNYNGTSYAVKAIGEYAFGFDNEILNISLPNSITAIKKNSFAGCVKLLSITIPQSVTSIDRNTFNNCSNLSSIIVESGNTVYDSRGGCNAIIKTSSNKLVVGCRSTIIPNSVTTIGEHAFYGNSSIESFSVPTSVLYIEDYAFCNCENLVKIELPRELQFIGKGCFSGCSSLQSIFIPKNVTSIGDYAFTQCVGLKTIVVENGNPNYDSRDNCNAIIKTSTNSLILGCSNTFIPESVRRIGQYAFEYLPFSDTIILPEGLTSIEMSAFYRSKLKSIRLPRTLNYIGNMAFAYCESLSKVFSDIELPFSISPAVFEHISSSAVLYVPENSKIQYMSTDGWKDNFEDIIEVEVKLSTYTLNITSSGNGTASYNNMTIRNKTSTFTVNEGISATISFSPDAGYRIKNVKVNGSTVSISNNQYVVGNISANTTVEVEFEALKSGIDITQFVSAACLGGSIRQTNNLINSGSQLMWGFYNRSTENVTLNSLQLIDGQTGSEGNIMTVNQLVEAGNSVGYTTTIGILGIHTPVTCRFRYTYNGSEYSTDAVYEDIHEYSLSIKSTGNGQVTYNGNTIRNTTKSYSVERLKSVTITITPDNGYKIKSVKVNSRDVTSSVSDNKYTISLITNDQSVEVEFEAIQTSTYTLSITASGNGWALYNSMATRSTTSTYTVNEGSSATITFSPDTGYRIKVVKVNGSTVSVSDNKYTVSNIKANTTVSVEFEAIPITTYTLAITASGNGSASYNNTTIRSKTSTFTVNEGTSATISFSPDAGYRIKSVKVNNTIVSVSDNKYTISSIKANTTVSVEFEAIPITTYTLSITVSGNGSASYNNTTIRSNTSTFTVNEGTSATISFSPDAGYRIKSVKINNWMVSISDSQYIISNIKANMSVSVEFEAIPPTTYTLSITASGNGSASYDNTTIRSKTSTFTVNEGTSVTISFSPDAGYRIKELKVNNSTVSVSNNQYTISSINANTTISVEFEAIPPTTYALSITASGSGSASYNNTTIRNNTSTFTVNEGTSATISFSPDAGYRIKSVKVNNWMVSVSDSQYIISDIKSNKSVEVEFVEDVKSFSINDVHYSVLSYDDRTVKVTAGNFGIVLEIPEKVTYKDLEWNVTGIEDDIISGNKELAAIIWNPSVEFKASVSNPNLLLYVKSASYAPSTINNVIVNDIADNIVLTDAVSGNNFYCPKEFMAKKISYTHNYGMTTGIGESRGWETIALPFDVKTIAHSSKGELTPFANWKSGDTAKPFWLMSYGAGGWSNASSIKANTPYIISMPNNPDYKQEYRINGSITFSAEDVKVKKSDDLQTGSYNGNTFIPNFTNAENSGCLALNVNNDYVTYNGGSAEGSRFIVNLRPLYPFEAYMTSTSGARKYISINEDMTTGIEDISVMLDEAKGIRVYDLKGQMIISDTDMSIDEIRKSLPAGVYIVNGKKLIIK